MEGIENILCGDNELEKQLLWKNIEKKNRLYKHEHPLLNPMLLTQIFKYASPAYDDLKSFRLVCQLWNDLTLPKWRETATLKLNRETEQLTGLPCSYGGIPVSKFLELLEMASKLDHDPFQLAELPFQRYKLCNVNIDLGQLETSENPALKQFWEIVGPQMKYLHLEQCTLVQSTFTEVPMETLILEKAKNLEELVLSQVKIKRKDFTAERPKSLVTLIRERPRVQSKLKSLSVDGKLCPFIIPEVVRCSGGLEKLVLKNVTNLDENLWKSLFAFRRLSAFKEFNLTEIDLINVPNGLTALDGVHRARLPVKTLRVQMSPGQELAMVRVMAAFGWTLETLEIFGVKGDRGEFHNVFVGELPILKELRLWGNVVKNLGFLRFMPKLKILWMNLLCAEKWGRESGNGQLWKVLTGDVLGEMGENEIFGGLECFRIDCELGVEGLMKVGKMMPNLKSLETVLNGSSFGVVGKLWPGLEKLGCLLGSRIDDGVVTGMRLPVRRRKEGDDFEGMEMGIKRFRYLKTFRFEEFCGKGKLTDESLVNGFLDMFRLENLEISVSAEMTCKAENLLKKTISNVKVIRNFDNVSGRMTEEELDKHRFGCLACKTKELLDMQWVQLVVEADDILEGDDEGMEGIRSSTPSTVVMEGNED